MATREVQLELLLGKLVVDPDGKRVGHIEEFHAEEDGDDCVIREFLVGGRAWLERLAVWGMARAMVRRIGAERVEGYRVPWDQLDLRDPERPRLRCPVAALAPRVRAKTRRAASGRRRLRRRALRPR